MGILRSCACLAIVSSISWACGESRPAIDELEIGGPSLTVSTSELGAALQCTSALLPGDRAVLLVHGTSVTPEENWGWNWQRALPELGFVPCSVRLPDFGKADREPELRDYARD